jgi:effector-binding domain-containing protein
MTVVGAPTIEVYETLRYVGIRVQTPMKGMFQVADKLRKELMSWVNNHGVEPSGVSFLRYHVIDMLGEMDIEVGIPTNAEVVGDGRVNPGILPAGRYGTLIYSGHGLTATKALLKWAQDNGLKWERWDNEKGDVFAGRYEAYLTDPRVQPLKSKWDIQLSIKLADDP